MVPHGLARMLRLVGCPAERPGSTELSTGFLDRDILYVLLICSMVLFRHASALYAHQAPGNSLINWIMMNVDIFCFNFIKQTTVERFVVA